jgi:hypothetical protein
MVCHQIGVFGITDGERNGRQQAEVQHKLRYCINLGILAVLFI